MAPGHLGPALPARLPFHTDPDGVVPARAVYGPAAGSGFNAPPSSSPSFPTHQPGWGCHHVGTCVMRGRPPRRRNPPHCSQYHRLCCLHRPLHAPPALPGRELPGTDLRPQRRGLLPRRHWHAELEGAAPVTGRGHHQLPAAERGGALRHGVGSWVQSITVRLEAARRGSDHCDAACALKQGRSRPLRATVRGWKRAVADWIPEQQASCRDRADAARQGGKVRNGASRDH